ncbi:hypothetical protein N8K70_03190 [Microbacterium betulae]|uniref:DUF2142 domain-containing protein n=1 Tax=Microbacterium betulae TaxID=2981139 RepID=A0AA97I6Z8_9MICO|nr:hypothetical protein [Microbacterium sp. AB]WOF23697.1 hypothetical protein N8K70_03190 [Microbacterium sp. AB]
MQTPRCAWKTWAARIGAIVVGAVLLQVVFFSALVVTESIPNDRILQKLQQDAQEQLWSDANFVPDGVSRNGLLDAYTDCISLTTGLYAQELSPFQRAVRYPHLGNCEESFQALEQIEQGAPFVQRFYPRYWGGNSVIIRPLLAMGGISLLRTVVLALAVGSVALLLTCSARRSALVPGVVMLVPLAFSTNMFAQTVYGFTHLLEFAVAAFMATLPFFLRRLRPFHLFATGFLAGSVFNYMDFLHNPSIAWSLFVFSSVLVTFRRGVTTWRLVGWALLAVASWIVGYAFTWGSRWMIAVLWGGETLTELIGKMFLWTGEGEPERAWLGESSKTATGYWIHGMPSARIVLALLLVLAIVFIVRAVRSRGSVSWPFLAVGLATAAVNPVWLEVMSGHSIHHVFFTYLAIPFGLGIVASTLLVSGWPSSRKPEPVAVAPT